MKFTIEQLAFYPPDAEKAKKLLAEIGLANEWIEDHVTARGSVMGFINTQNEANLSFTYPPVSLREIEVLEYTDGRNWMEYRTHSISHLGMHCTDQELAAWRAFFLERDIGIVQEVETQRHTNPAIKDTRRYRYVIFNTHPILGVDLKFIVRKDVA